MIKGEPNDLEAKLGKAASFKPTPGNGKKNRGVKKENSSIPLTKDKKKKKMKMI